MSEVDIYKRQAELYKTSLDEGQEVVSDYKARIDKAIEYIEENYFTPTINDIDKKYYLLNILRGEDK